jgi:anti-sigma regulatory factor (Ser/Thr protein kinase)
LEAQEERTFGASRAEVPHVRHWIQGLAEEASFSAVSSDLALAVSEAVANAVLHSGTAQLRVRWTAENHQAVIEIVDDGIYDREAVSPDGGAGFGLPIMTALVDEFSIQHGTAYRPGTTVRLVKRKR